MTPDMIRRVCPKAWYVDQIAARLMLLTSIVPGRILSSSAGPGRGNTHFPAQRRFTYAGGPRNQQQLHATSAFSSIPWPLHRTAWQVWRI